MTPIPVTVLGGYLGSGKTTVLNNLLSQPHGRRIAVLVNDFGPINLDASLIASRSDSVIELTNGCICCSLVDGFADAMHDILERADADPESRPEHLVIETSGVALPGSVAQFAHRRGFVLDSIVVTADCEQIADQLQDRRVGDTIRTQLASADLVLLTKSDLISRSDDEATTSLLSSLLSSLTDAVAIPTTWGNVPFDVLLAPRAGTSNSGWNATSGSNEGVTLAAVASQIETAPTMTRAELDKILSSLPSDCVRAKGVVHLDGELHHVDRVGRRSTIRPVRAADSDAWKLTKSFAPEVDTIYLVLLQPADLEDK